MGDLRNKVAKNVCEDWKALTAQYDELSLSKNGASGSHWIYRGEASESWVLQPMLERFAESLPNNLRGNRRELEEKLEAQLLRDFQGAAAQFLTNLPSSEEKLEWLALLQHHGAPTRLLDWTYSPTVATYFALRNQPNRREASRFGMACVWAINLGKIKEKMKQLANCKDWHEAYRHGVSRLQNSLEPGIVMPFLPRRLILRMTSQQGLFLAKTTPRDGFMACLAKTADLEDRGFVRRLLIPSAARVDCLAHLMEHNTHEVGLFPDIDGLGRFVHRKVEVLAQTVGLE
jgi:hypothetical protein